MAKDRIQVGLPTDMPRIGAVYFVALDGNVIGPMSDQQMELHEEQFDKYLKGLGPEEREAAQEEFRVYKTIRVR